MTFHQLVMRGRATVDAWAKDAESLATLRALLEHAYVPVLQLLGILTVLCLLASLPAARRLAQRVSRRSWLALLGIFYAALLLRLHWVPHLPQVYFDEILFLDTADNMARLGVNILSTFEGKHYGPEFHPCPQGWQFLLSLWYHLVGSSPYNAFNAASWLSAATVIGLFVAVYEATDSERAGLLAAAGLAVLPVHLRLGGSAALETASAFFLVATVASATLWLRERSVALMALAACMLAWFVNIRMENSFALTPLLLLAFAAACPSEALSSWKTRGAAVAAWTLVLLLGAPAVLADFYGLATRFYFFYAPPHEIEQQVSTNLIGNVSYWFDNGIHPVLITALAAIGFGAARWRRLAWGAGLWWLALVMFYSFNPSCDFALLHTLDSWRTALHPTLGLVVLAALGAETLLDWLEQRSRAHWGLGLLLAWCITVPVAYQAFIQARTFWMVAWETQERVGQVLPPDAWLLVHDNHPRLGAHSSALARELAWTCGTQPHYFAIPTNYEGRPGEPLPFMATAAEQWVKVEKRKVFLYHLNTGTHEETQGLELLRRVFELEPLLEGRESSTHSAFRLFAVRGARGRQPQAAKPSQPSSRSGQAAIPTRG
jgi:hypothetical protein